MKSNEIASPRIPTIMRISLTVVSETPSTFTVTAVAQNCPDGDQDIDVPTEGTRTQHPHGGRSGLIWSTRARPTPPDGRKGGSLEQAQLPPPSSRELLVQSVPDRTLADH